MSLYDDLDTIKTKTTEKVAGWSSGIKLLQSQLQLKKAATTAPKRDQIRKASLAPVIDLKSKKDDDIYPNLKPSTSSLSSSSSTTTFSVVVERGEPPQFPIIPAVSVLASDYDWDVIGEYDPLWPNEYEKVVKELREQRERENEKQQDERDKKQRDRRRKSRFSESGEEPMPPPTPQTTTPPTATTLSGFAGRWEADEDEPVVQEPLKPSRSGGGVAIAPPPSLQELVAEPPAPTTPPPPSNNTSYGTSSVAARIMAKYGFKEGQGLGKKEQGMSMALQVEKTSKRGGRIIHEKEIMPPPPPALGGSPVLGQIPDFVPKPEPSITEIMRSPSKIVLLRNMVGPGEVDEELEPEVKDECNTKYGDVIKVIINEIESLPADEAVRIFVEFKRIESAIKAVVDLNGRFFGGRTVKAGFYDVERFAAMQLMDGL